MFTHTRECNIPLIAILYRWVAMRCTTASALVYAKQFRKRWLLFICVSETFIYLNTHNRWLITRCIAALRYPTNMVIYSSSWL